MENMLYKGLHNRPPMPPSACCRMPQRSGPVLGINARSERIVVDLKAGSSPPYGHGLSRIQHEVNDYA